MALAWESLKGDRIRSSSGSAQGLTVVKIGDLLARRGVMVPHRTLHRYCVERTDYRGRGRGRRCRWPTVSPAWSARSISPEWV